MERCGIISEGTAYVWILEVAELQTQSTTFLNSLKMLCEYRADQRGRNLRHQHLNVTNEEVQRDDLRLIAIVPILWLCVSLKEVKTRMRRWI